MTLLNTRTEKMADQNDVELCMLEFISIHKILLHSLSVNIAVKG